MASLTNPSQTALDDCWNRIGVRGDRSCAELARHIHCRNCPLFSAAARTLLDVPALVGFRQTATEHFARPAQDELGHVAGADMQSAIVFRLRAEWYAIRTAACLEIADLRPIHSLPHRRDAAVLGVVNVRGELLVCISLALILGATVQPEGISTPSPRRAAMARLLVARGSTGTVVFPVDEVQGMERFCVRDLRDVPATVAQARKTYTHALISLADRTVGLLDQQRLFDTVDRALA
jgi:chemotaxis-related protein WspD